MNKIEQHENICKELNDIYQNIDRIKKGMAMVDARIDKNGNEMSDDSFNMHMAHLEKMMREVSEEGYKQGVNWSALLTETEQVKMDIK